MTKLNFGRDVQGLNAFAPSFPDLKYSATLASGGSDDLDVPSSNPEWIVVFSYQPGSAMWVSVNGTAAAPAGGTFAANASVLNPAQLKVFAGDNIDVYNNSSSGQDVGISLYAV